MNIDNLIAPQNNSNEFFVEKIALLNSSNADICITYTLVEIDKDGNRTEVIPVSPGGRVCKSKREVTNLLKTGHVSCASLLLGARPIPRVSEYLCSRYCVPVENPVCRDDNEDPTCYNLLILAETKRFMFVTIGKYTPEDGYDMLFPPEIPMEEEIRIYGWRYLVDMF